MPFVRIGGAGVGGREPLGETVKGLGGGWEVGIGPERSGKCDVDLGECQTGVWEGEKGCANFFETSIAEGVNGGKKSGGERRLECLLVFL